MQKRENGEKTEFKLSKPSRLHNQSIVLCSRHCNIESIQTQEVPGQLGFAFELHHITEEKRKAQRPEESQHIGRANYLHLCAVTSALQVRFLSYHIIQYEKPCVCIMCDQRLKDAKQNATPLQQRTPEQRRQQHQKGLQGLVPPPPLVALFSKQRQQSSSTSANVALGHSSASTRTPAPATSRNPRALHNSQHRALETHTASDSK